MNTLIESTHKLKIYLACAGMSAAAFARSLGYTPQMITGYLNRSRKMSLRGALMIEHATNGHVTKEYILEQNPEYDSSNTPEKRPRKKKKLEVNLE